MTSPAPFKKMLPPFPGPKQADGTSKEIEPVELFTKTWGAAVCDGFYPLGLNGQWHGGIHFDADTNSKFNQGDGVRCIADGEVIAYRFDDIPPKSIYKNFEQVNAQFATGFVLVRHRLQIPVEFAQPPATSSGGTATPSGGAAPNAPPPPSFVFYSLYMHLLNWKAYEDDPGIKRPGFLGIDSNSGFVGEKCIVPAPSGQNWGHTNSEGVVENPAPPAGKKGEDVLDARAGQNNAIIGWVPGGTQLTLGKTIGDHRLIVGIKGDSYRLNSINQTGLIAHGKIKVSNLDTVIKPPQVKDAVHIMPEPVAIKAGDLVGHLGNYLRFNPEVLNKATHRSVVHMEVITGNGLFEFIEKCRELDANAADTLKNLLLIKKGAKPVGPSGPSARLAGGGFMVDETGPKEGEWMKLLRGSFEVIEKGKLTGWDKAKKRYGSDKDPKYFYQALKPNVASGTTPDPTKPGDFTDPKSGAEFIGKEANFPQHTWRKVFIPGQEVVWIHRSSHSYLSQQTRSGVFEVIDNSYVEGWARFPLKAGEGEVGEPVLATQVYDLKKKDNPFVTSYALDDANPAHRWWKVSYPVMTKNGCVGPQTGWVCEKDFEKVCKCSPWAWPGFEMSVGEDSLGPLEYYKRRLAKDYQPEKSAYLKQLFEVLDEDGNKQLTSKELRQGWEKSWLAQSLSRQIIHHYSEWGLAKSEWDALDEYMQETADKVKTSSISFKDVWQEEKKRIEKLQFWEEVKGQWGFPEDIKVWHVHPLGLVENFYALEQTPIFRAPWLNIAWKEYEKYKDCKEKDEPLFSAIGNYYSITNQSGASPTKEPWCGAFVNWCLNEVGYGRPHPNKEQERTASVRWGYYPDAWKKGEDHGKPFVGAIAVTNYNHVAFVVGETDKGRLVLLGGNQPGPNSPPNTGEYINLRANARGAVLYYMKPKGYDVQPEEEDLPIYDDSNLGAGLSNANTR